MSRLLARLAPGLLLGALCLPGGVAARSPYAGFDDPRPTGHLSVRERTQCEAPEDRPGWCEFPHEVRVFLDRRDGCDHFRGEPVPERTDDPKGARRREIETALRRLCTGTDAELARLRTSYRNDAAVTAALAEFEDEIE